MPHLPPPKTTIVIDDRVTLPPVEEPVKRRFEIKRLIQTPGFLSTLPEELAQRVRDIFSGCGCHTEPKVTAILPEIQGYIDALTN